MNIFKSKRLESKDFPENNSIYLVIPGFFISVCIFYFFVRSTRFLAKNYQNFINSESEFLKLFITILAGIYFMIKPLFKNFFFKNKSIKNLNIHIFGICSVSLLYLENRSYKLDNSIEEFLGNDISSLLVMFLIFATSFSNNKYHQLICGLSGAILIYRYEYRYLLLSLFILNFIIFKYLVYDTKKAIDFLYEILARSLIPVWFFIVPILY